MQWLVTQFYNTVELEEDHWKYQRVVWYKAMDHLSDLEKGVVRTASSVCRSTV